MEDVINLFLNFFAYSPDANVYVIISSIFLGIIFGIYSVLFLLDKLNSTAKYSSQQNFIALSIASFTVLGLFCAAYIMQWVSPHETLLTFAVAYVMTTSVMIAAIALIYAFLLLLFNTVSELY